MQKGIIETTSGDLCRAGFCDFENDGSYDNAVESYRTDVPFPAKVRGDRDETEMHRWNGSSWIEAPQP